VLPFPSSYVHVITPLPYIGNVASCVTVTMPPQLSVAVGGVKDVIAHGSFKSGNTAKSGIGSVMSSITIFCV